MLVHFMYKAVGPLVSRFGDIDLVMDLLAEGIVRDLMVRLQMKPPEIAAHLGRHVNSVAPIFDRIEKRVAAGGLISDTGLRADLMMMLVKAFPQARSVAEISDHLRVAADKVLNQLDALRKAHIIGWEDGKYKALANIEKGSLGDKRDRVLEAMTVDAEIGNRYVEGDPETVVLRVQALVAEEDSARLMADIRDYAIARGAELVKEYYQKYPDGLGRSRVVKGTLFLGSFDPDRQL